MDGTHTDVVVLDDSSESNKMRCIGYSMEVKNMAGLTFEARLHRGETMWYTCQRHAYIGIGVVTAAGGGGAVGTSGGVIGLHIRSEFKTGGGGAVDSGDGSGTRTTPKDWKEEASQKESAEETCSGASQE